MSTNWTSLKMASLIHEKMKQKIIYTDFYGTGKYSMGKPVFQFEHRYKGIDSISFLKKGIDSWSLPFNGQQILQKIRFTKSLGKIDCLQLVYFDRSFSPVFGKNFGAELSLSDGLIADNIKKQPIK